MPRFVSPSFTSPPPMSSRDALIPYGGDASSSDVSSSSVKLSCLSPNGRAIHSLAVRNSVAYIETYSLPLVGTTTVEEEDNNNDDSSIPAVVRTSLPDAVRLALERYPAIELLCVDVDSTTTPLQSSSRSSSSGQIEKIPKLCLYTKKDVFIFELGYKKSSGTAASSSSTEEVEGIVLAAVKEPFDPVLMGTSTSTSIIRIRQAPQKHMGYATMCPPEAMAMLTHDSITNEYSITLYHGNGSVGTPHVYGMEQLEEQTERITDFCFLQSNAFSLLSSMSVALLKGSGDVLLASPILFRGTVIPRGTVTKTMEYLEAGFQRAEPNTAKWRQFRVAKQYILDAFPDDGRSHFLTAQVVSAAYEWPVQIQGPVLVPPESDDFETLAAAIEPVVAGDLVGVSIGHLGNIVEFGVLSPTTLIPRFKLENAQDTSQLDQELTYGAIVNRVDLRDDEKNEQHNNSSMALIRDPIMDSVVHYVTPTGVKSISSNAVKITANKVRMQPGGGGTSMFSPPSKKREMRPKTTAWSCMDVSNIQDQTISLSGAVVSGDVHLGHVLVSRLSDGKMVAVNLTETRQLQEMEALGDATQRLMQGTGVSAVDQELRALPDTSPLVDIVEPLVQKVVAGIGGMSKVVGSSTPTSDVTPDQIAAASSVKERCDKEILLPLVEMNEHVTARSKELLIMYENQMAQLKDLREMIAKLKGGINGIHEKADTVGANAKSLAQRSESVLQSSNDLMPTITQAQFDYYRELQRLDSKTKDSLSEVQRLNLKVGTIRDSIESGTTAGRLDLTPENVHNCNTMLKACTGIISKHKIRLKDAEEKVDELAVVAGIDRNPHGLVDPLL